MSKKETEDKKATFDLEVALRTVNTYLLPGFIDYIKGEKITTQKQFDKIYNDYKEFK